MSVEDRLHVPGRVAFSARPGLRDRLHGAWWPTSTRVEPELRHLLAEAQPRLTAVQAVTLNRKEWPDAPLVVRPLPTRSPTINWYGLHEDHLAVLHYGGYHRLVLLLIPPETPEDVAAAAMRLATTPGNTLGSSATLATAHDQVPADTELREDSA